MQDVHQFEEMIETHLEETYTSVAKLIPDEALIDIFLYKNDYQMCIRDRYPLAKAFAPLEKTCGW